MFKVFFAIASFLTAFGSENALRGEAISSFLDDSDEWKQFSNFQERFSKQYETFEEVETRFQIFRTNLRNIIIHNLDHSQNFTMGINQFTDLTPNEFKAQYVSGLKAEVGSYGCKTFSSGASGAPDSVTSRPRRRRHADPLVLGLQRAVRPQRGAGDRRPGPFGLHALRGAVAHRQRRAPDGLHLHEQQRHPRGRR